MALAQKTETLEAKLERLCKEAMNKAHDMQIHQEKWTSRVDGSWKTERSRKIFTAMAATLVALDEAADRVRAKLGISDD